MKVEVELDDLQSMREQIRRLTAENTDLLKQMKALDQENLKSNAVKLAEKMFEDYLSTTLEKLGYDLVHPETAIKWDYEVLMQSTLKMLRHERLVVEPCGYVSERFSQAFLRIGLKPKERVTEEID